MMPYYSAFGQGYAPTQPRTYPGAEIPVAPQTRYAPIQHPQTFPTYPTYPPPSLNPVPPHGQTFAAVPHPAYPVTFGVPAGHHFSHRAQGMYLPNSTQRAYPTMQPYSPAFFSVGRAANIQDTPAVPAANTLAAEAPTVNATEPPTATSKRPTLPTKADAFTAMRREPVAPPAGSTDIFRDTPVRYLGFANEVTESVKEIGPRWSKFNPVGWVLSFGYGGLDAISKAKQGYTDSRRAGDSHNAALKDGGYELGKGLAFHSAGSWFGPILVLNQAKKFAARALKKPLHHPVVAITSLSVIPLITKTFDPALEALFKGLDTMLGKR